MFGDKFFRRVQEAQGLELSDRAARMVFAEHTVKAAGNAVEELLRRLDQGMTWNEAKLDATEHYRFLSEGLKYRDSEIRRIAKTAVEKKVRPAALLAQEPDFAKELRLAYHFANKNHVIPARLYNMFGQMLKPEFKEVYGAGAQLKMFLMGRFLNLADSGERTLMSIYDLGELRKAGKISDEELVKRTRALAQPYVKQLAFYTGKGTLLKIYRGLFYWGASTLLHKALDEPQRQDPYAVKSAKELIRDLTFGIATLGPSVDPDDSGFTVGQKVANAIGQAASVAFYDSGYFGAFAELAPQDKASAAGEFYAPVMAATLGGFFSDIASEVRQRQKKMPGEDVGTSLIYASGSSAARQVPVLRSMLPTRIANKATEEKPAAVRKKVFVNRETMD
jgi:hypothetical protein